MYRSTTELPLRADIDATPLVGVLAALIAVMAMGAPRPAGMLTRSIAWVCAIPPPGAAAPRHFGLHLDRAGILSLDGKTIDPDRLRTHVHRWSADPRVTVEVAIDADAAWKDALRVLALLDAQGLDGSRVRVVDRG